MSPPSESPSSAAVVFRAKLPDDVGADEFAALLQAISVLDDEVVSSVRASPEAEFFTPELRTVEPSVIRRVQYGSDFEVVLGLVAQGVVPIGVLVGSWVGIAKSISYIADARLKSEERKGKRDERLARRRERAAAERVATRRYVWPLGFVEFEDADVEILPSGELRSETEARQVREALDVILPADTRTGAEAALPADLRTQTVVVAASQLAEYVVTVEVIPRRVPRSPDNPPAASA
jgi:hypothetical protein